jgi:magnesium transporter
MRCLRCTATCAQPNDDPPPARERKEKASRVGATISIYRPIGEAYSNIMTNNLNRRVELLTSITVVLTIPTIVFSLWAINVPVPGADNPLAFAIITVSTIVAMVAILYWLYKKSWL